jgi:O-antigen/teichoic acid export membrane protein
VNLKVDQIMLKWMSGNRDVGYYAVAVTLSEAWYFIATAIVTSVFPSLIEDRKANRAVYQKRLQKIFDILFLLALAVAVIVTIFSRLLVKTLYGDVYLYSANILTIHVWAGLFAFMRQLFSRWLIMEGLLKYSLFSHGFGAFLNVILNALLIPRLGGIGAAIATLFSYAGSSYLALFLSRPTRPIAYMMSRSLFSPFRIGYGIIRRAFARGPHGHENS